MRTKKLRKTDEYEEKKGTRKIEKKQLESTTGSIPLHDHHHYRK